MALVLTLMVVAIITAMVVEFAYGVYTNTNALNNWQTSQKLSLHAKSGTTLASRLISEYKSQSPKAYPGFFEISQKIPSDDFEGTISIRIEDENAKFNLKRLNPSTAISVKESYDSFIRLLEALNLDKDIADRITDWIDSNSDPRLQDSENVSKNADLDSIDELLLIPGIDRDSYEKLLPYVTIYGNNLININSADIPALMSLSSSITKEIAERIVNYRENTSFIQLNDIFNVSGIGIGVISSSCCDVSGSVFRVISTAESHGIKRIAESIIESSGSNVIKYWKEM